MAEQSGYDSVEEKIRRLTERIDELDGREREGKEKVGWRKDLLLRAMKVVKGQGVQSGEYGFGSGI